MIQDKKIKKSSISFTKVLLITTFVLAIIGCLGLIIGGIWDLRISKAIAGSNREYFVNKWYEHTFQWHFSGFAGFVATIIFAFSVVTVFTIAIPWNKWAKKGKIFYFIAGGLFCLMLILWQTYDGFIAILYESFNIKHKSYPIYLHVDFLWQALIVSIFLFVVFFGINYFFIRKSHAANSIAKWSIFATIALVLAYVVVSVMKAQIHRERYFQIETTGHEYNFRPWYSLLWNMNTSPDTSPDWQFQTSDMTSFPSGHTSFAMNAVLLIPLFYILLMNKKTLLIILSILCIGFVIATMFCRIATGNHYLSDVSGAVIINLSCYIVVFVILYFQSKHEQKNK